MAPCGCSVVGAVVCAGSVTRILSSPLALAVARSDSSFGWQLGGWRVSPYPHPLMW